MIFVSIELPQSNLSLSSTKYFHPYKIIHVMKNSCYMDRMFVGDDNIFYECVVKGRQGGKRLVNKAVGGQ